MARTGKFVIKRGRGGKTHFVLLASNGRVAPREAGARRFVTQSISFMYAWDLAEMWNAPFLGSVICAIVV